MDSEDISLNDIDGTLPNDVKLHLDKGEEESDSNGAPGFGEELAVEMKRPSAPRNWFESYVSGHAPGLQELFPASVSFFVNDCLRSIGQVFFCDNPWTGLIILVANVIDKTMWGGAMYGAFAVLVSNLFALWLGVDANLRRHGLFGFNAYLVGLGISLFFKSISEPWVPDFYLISILIISCFTVVIIQCALNNFLVPTLKAPCFTLPFNIVLLGFLCDALRTHSRFSVNDDIVSPTMININDIGADSLGSENFVPAIFKGVSQVVFLNNTWSGVLIIIGICLYSRICVGTAVGGSVIGLLYGIIYGASSPTMQSGLWGYNSVLTSMALAGVFIKFSKFSVLYGALGAVLSVQITGAVRTLLQLWGLPALTVPFCLGTLLLLIAGRSFPNCIPVELADITFPEDALKSRQVERLIVQSRES